MSTGSRKGEKPDGQSKNENSGEGRKEGKKRREVGRNSKEKYKDCLLERTGMRRERRDLLRERRRCPPETPPGKGGTTAAARRKGAGRAGWEPEPEAESK